MPRQELIFLKNWSKRGMAPKADPVPCATEPSRIWTLFREEDEANPPELPFVPIHRVNAFAEDCVHDWNWYRHGSGPAMLNYYSRVVDGPVWILLEYDTEEEKSARRPRRKPVDQTHVSMIGSLDFNEAELIDSGYVKVEPAK